jgi:hypothetical protein
MVGRPRFDVAASRFLHGYQRVAYTPGPVLAVCVLLVLAALVTRRGPLRLRLDAALLAAFALGALLVSQALSVFSYRYGLIAPVLLPPAAALALTALLRGRRAALPVPAPGGAEAPAGPPPSPVSGAPAA